MNSNKLQHSKISLAAKLWSVFGIIAGFFFLTLLLNYFQINRSLDQTTRLEARLLPTVLKANQVEIGLYKTLSTLRQFMLTGDPYLKEKRQRIWRDDIFTSLAQIKAIDDHEDLIAIEALLNELKSSQKQLEDIARSEDNFPAQKVFDEKAAPYADKLLETFTLLIEVEKKEQTTAARKKILGLLSDVRESIPQVLASLRSYIISGDQRFKKSYQTSLKATSKAFENLLEEQFSLTPEQFNKVDETVVVMEVFLANCELVSKRREARDWNMANYLLETKAQPLQKELEDKLKAYKNNQSNLFNHSFKEQNEALASSLKREWLILAISILLFLFIGLQIHRHLLKPITQLSEALNQFDTETNPDVSFDVTRQNDEVGALAMASERLRKTIVAKIKEIEDQKRVLEKRVEERTAELSVKHRDLKSIMDNVKVGIMTVDIDGTIGSDYSAYTKELFRTTIEQSTFKELAGQNVFDVLFKHSKLGQSQMDQARVAMNSMMNANKIVYKLNEHLLTRKMAVEYDGQQKFFSLKWDAVVDAVSSNVTSLLLVVSDMTELIGLQKQSHSQSVRLRLLDMILESGLGRLRTTLKSEISKATEIIDRIHRDGDHIRESTLYEIFRELHTLKGNSRVNGFATITDIVHSMESLINRAQLSPEAYSYEHFMGLAQEIYKELNTYLSTIDHYADQLGSSDQQLTDELRKIIKLKGKAPEIIGREVLGLLKKSDGSTIEGILEPMRRNLAKLAQELNKEEPELLISSTGICYHEELAHALKGIFMHLFNNAMDHGIESGEVRRFLQKPPRGVIRITEAQNASGDAELTIEDDGQGLDLTRLAEKSGRTFESRDELTSHAEEIALTIFEQGITTAGALTTISGRGVGMDAVKGLVESQGCQLQLILGQITEEQRANFRLVMTIPREFIEESWDEQRLNCG